MPLPRLIALTLLVSLSLIQQANAKPNIVLIVADDLGYGDLGCYGGQEIPTPSIDSLAQQGVRCSSGYVSGPYCSPTRAALLTGRYQQRFGHEFNPGPQPDQNFGLSLKETTLPQRLKADGYVTGMVGKWHLGLTEQFHPNRRGFDEFFGFLGGAHPYFPVENDRDPIQRNGTAVDEKTYLTDAFAREALKFIDAHHNEPFFLYLPFNAVHNPQHARPELLEKFESIPDQRRRTYAGMLTAMDEAIGQVLQKVDDLKLNENTLVLFISDNGGPPANGSTNTPLNGQKSTTWEGGVRVPFMLRWTGKLPAGKTYDHPAIQIDLLPTILAAAEVEVGSDAKLDGVNLLPHLTGDKTEPPHESLFWRFGQQMAIRQGDWKLVQARDVGKPQLYNLKDDIGEKNDLSATHPDKVKELQTAWDAWNADNVPPTWTPEAQRNPRRQNRRQQNN